ncbi:Cof-type HAD-IIB family hydrolase [Paenibacillus alkaliterrae]|uniref:Cof-type HAD-IIB family hydrolase n=1 Tax=Paenibacillus alkaliterrae TaxID=320909 RepID=UPI001F2067D7|nr:Cof-type HAD-IIB family hydrolase [Paenibacillus alkaliterrae]MCF2941332.1 Cof-type HAD-IIB family hydrolase [Paenibacillus alkaliterrae]
MSGKMVFFDIDGTLLDHDKKLPVSTQQAIRNLKRVGHGVAIATGRGPFMFKELREQLEIDSFVSYNGQYAVWKDKPVFQNPLQPELLQELTEYADENEHPLVYMDVETMRSNKDYHVYIEESISTLKVPHPAHDAEYFRGRDIYQTLVFCTIEEEPLYRERFPNLDFIRWHPLSMDVLPLGGSKARGIEALINQIGISKDDVYAFGDYLNDIEMLQFVGTGIAMGNSPDIVKRAAKHVTRDVSEDGILYGLKMVRLL